MPEEFVGFRFSYSLGGFLCSDCSKNEDNSKNIKVHEKIRLFLAEISKTDFCVQTKYDSLVNLAVLEKCFGFIKKYMDNISHKKTKVFEVLENFNTGCEVVKNG